MTHLKNHPMTPTTNSAEVSGLTDERLAEMLAGLEGVTPGPWTEHEKGIHPNPYVCGSPTETECGVDKFVVAYVVGLNSDKNKRHIARCDPDTMRALITELQSFHSNATAATSEVRVKPLEWAPGGQEWTSFDADSVFGIYRVIEEREGVWFVAGAAAARPAKDCTDPKQWCFDWAQANHRARILSALSPAPSQTGGEVVGDFVGSCVSCDGTGDLGGNPSYGVCPYCEGSGKSASPVIAPAVEADWIRDTAMNVMLASEVEEAVLILTAALRPSDSKETGE